MQADSRSETGCIVLAIPNDGGTIGSFNLASFTVRSNDDIVLTATDEGIHRFESDVPGEY